MIPVAYWTAAGITFTIVFVAFLGDPLVSRRSPKEWIFMITAGLLWPITLPYIVRSRWQKRQAQRQTETNASEASHQTANQTAHQTKLSSLPLREISVKRVSDRNQAERK